MDQGEERRWVQASAAIGKGGKGPHLYAATACNHERRRPVAHATDLREPPIGEGVTATDSW